MDDNDPAAGRSENVDPVVVMDRLSARFGEDAIRPLVERFAAMLEEALASLDRGDGGRMAHRIAGVAGTLGFTTVGRTWLALDKGAVAADESVRRESETALAIIAERYGNATGHHT